MIRTLVVSLAAAVALVGCGEGAQGQSVSVTIGDRDCEVSNTDLESGDATFNVRNVTAKGATFVITEDEGTKDVGRVNVEPGSMKSLVVHLDGDDVYQVRCGDVTGPEIDPGG
jgi:uncharacterized cupredoxin-like copper-binding protein